MKRLTMMLSLLVMFASCKKDSPVIEVLPETIPELIVSIPITGRISYEIDGKLYNNYLKEVPFYSVAKGIGNDGVDFKQASNGSWASHPDSIQYTKHFEATMGESGAYINIKFIKKYARKDMLKGVFFYPKSDFEMFSNTKPKFVLDYGRENNEEGVALKVGLPKGLTYRSYIPVERGQKSTLTAESHRNSTFRILKAERTKNPKVLLIELSFEADLFDENEKPIRLTKGAATFEFDENDNVPIIRPN